MDIHLMDAHELFDFIHIDTQDELSDMEMEALESVIYQNYRKGLASLHDTTTKERERERVLDAFAFKQSMKHKLRHGHDMGTQGR